MIRPLRVVLDTNVVLSALLFRGGTMGQLRHAWQEGLCVPLLSTQTAQELMRVLAYPKFRLSPLDQEELLSDYLPHTEVVQIPARLPVVPPCRDPHDLPFLHLAASGRAQMLVTGDLDLLTLAAQTRFRILDSAAFLRCLSG